MYRRVLSLTGLAAAAVLTFLLINQPAAAQQGMHLYQWSGNWGYAPPSSTDPAPSELPGAPTTSEPATNFAAPSIALPSFIQGLMPPTGQSFGSEESDIQDMSRDVFLNVTVPQDAQIWIQGTATRSQGPFRRFVSPPLEPGREYNYELKVTWKEQGKEMTRTRTVPVHAGQVIDLSFNSNAQK